MAVLGKPIRSHLKMTKLRSIQKFLEISSIPVNNEVTVLGSSRDFFSPSIYDFFFSFSFLNKVGIVVNIQRCHLLYLI